jgi:hypothetical protein
MIGFESTKWKPELFLEPPGEKSQVTEEIIISCRIFYSTDAIILQFYNYLFGRILLKLNQHDR